MCLAVPSRVVELNGMVCAAGRLLKAIRGFPTA